VMPLHHRGQKTVSAWIRLCLGTPGSPGDQGSSTTNDSAALPTSLPDLPDLHAIVSSSTTESRPVTRAQRGIHRPHVYTDGTIKYGKHSFITSSNIEPYFVDDALTDKN
jgi:hypothetical protein